MIALRFYFRTQFVLLFSFVAEIGLSCGKSHLQKGDDLFRKWELKAALEEYESVFQADSTNPELLNKMGIILTNLELYPDAMALFDRALKFYPHTTVRKNREIARLLSEGHTAIHLNDYQKAIALYRQIFGLDSQQVIAHKNIGYCFLATGDTVAAREHFSRVMELLADYPSSYLYQIAEGEISLLRK